MAEYRDNGNTETDCPGKASYPAGYAPLGVTDSTLRTKQVYYMENAGQGGRVISKRKRTGKDIAAPKPLRTTSELGRILLRLEVPDCSCPLSKVCMDPAGCPGKKSCMECPPALDLENPCEHVAQAMHSVPIETWIDLLLLYDVEGYATRPLDEPRTVLTRRARVALYMDRARRGMEIFQPQDVHGDRIDSVSVQAGRGKVELRIRPTREE